MKKAHYLIITVAVLGLSAFFLNTSKPNAQKHEYLIISYDMDYRKLIISGIGKYEETQVDQQNLKSIHDKAPVLKKLKEYSQKGWEVKTSLVNKGMLHFILTQ